MGDSYRQAIEDQIKGLGALQRFRARGPGTPLQAERRTLRVDFFKKKGKGSPKKETNVRNSRKQMRLFE